MTITETISAQDFFKVDIRVGRITEVADFPEARTPSYKLLIDLGPEIGLKKSCAHLTQLYNKESLMGRQVLCCVNLPPKQVANFMSQVLTLGVPDEQERVVLIRPDEVGPLGAKLF